MRIISGLMVALAVGSVAATMATAHAGDTGQFTLLCQTTNSNGVKIGPRTVHIDLNTREVIDSQVSDVLRPIVTLETHARITQITDQFIGWSSYELYSNYDGVMRPLPKFEYQGDKHSPENVLDRYTLTIGQNSQCTLQTRKL